MKRLTTLFLVALLVGALGLATGCASRGGGCGGCGSKCGGCAPDRNCCDGCRQGTGCTCPR